MTASIDASVVVEDAISAGPRGARISLQADWSSCSSARQQQKIVRRAVRFSRTKRGAAVDLKKGGYTARPAPSFYKKITQTNCAVESDFITPFFGNHDRVSKTTTRFCMRNSQKIV
eukprot:30802-Pelagococcus_subviridis.AAC.16